MSNFDEIKAYFNDKFDKLKSAVEAKKMQNLLHLYFDKGGVGLKPAQINRVNELLRKNIVLTNADEIDKFTTEITTLATFKSGREHLKEMRKNLSQRMQDNDVISKSDACILARNIIIKRPASCHLYYDADGNAMYRDIPGKTYVVSVLPNTSQVVFSRKYNNEPIEKRKNIDETIKLFDKVTTHAYAAFRDQEM